MQIDDLGIGILLQQVIAHRMHQVSLAQAHAAIEEQRVVTMLGIVRHLPGRSTGQLVGLALDEIVEGEGTVQVAGVLEPAFHLNRALSARRSSLTGSPCHGIKTRTRRL
ncbi:hypothetical protein D3C72_2068690 [compost metagenome]